MSAPVDPVALTAALVRCASVTPKEAGALDLLETTLAPLGFRVERVRRGVVDNLLAIRGEGRPLFGFNGHVDVVPAGEAGAWSHDPFSAAMDEEHLWGRGSVDMKSGVAAFVAAASRYVAQGGRGALALLITGDEEGDAVDGTRALLDRLAERGVQLDACLVGEPTSAERFGDVMKIGRRGSMNAWITATGRQGHTAYPHKALNPLPALTKLLDRLASTALDQGTPHFAPSTLALTSIDVGNPATNVIPASGRAALNIRFNDQHSSDSLTDWLEREAAATAAETGVEITLATRVSGEAFLTPEGPLSELVAAAVEAETGARPEATTGGGTSDARFIRAHCPVVEFGLTGRGMHAVDEKVEIAEIERLTRVYHDMLRRFFGD